MDMESIGFLYPLFMYTDPFIQHTPQTLSTLSQSLYEENTYHLKLKTSVILGHACSVHI